MPSLEKNRAEGHRLWPLAPKDIHPFHLGYSYPPATHLKGAKMPDDEKQRFVEALAHWVDAVGAIRPRVVIHFSRHKKPALWVYLKYGLTNKLNAAIVAATIRVLMAF